MVFRIVNFRKGIDTYRVMGETGEVMDVRGVQVVGAMIQGHTFDNAHLTKKGFGIQTPTGVRYVQVAMTKQMSKMVADFIAQREAMKAELRAEEKAVKAVRKVAAQNTNQGCLGNRQRITSTKNIERIVYKGQPFSSPERLCAKFGRDVNTFLNLRAKGYTMDEALGLVPLRPESELQPTCNINKALDILDNARGEY